MIIDNGIVVAEDTIDNLKEKVEEINKNSRIIEEIEKENSELKLKKEGIESDLKLKRDNFIELDKNISSLNKENESNDYDKPTFYSDCSNPISLGYLYKDLLTNYSVSDNSKTISFNGKVLKEANISLEDITPTLNFTIHIVNNSFPVF